MTGRLRALMWSWTPWGPRPCLRHWTCSGLWPAHQHLHITADGDIERDRKEAERRGFRKVISIIDYARTRDSIREITNLIDAGLIQVPPTEVLPLEDPARAHQIIDTGHVRGKLVLRVAELCA